METLRCPTCLSLLPDGARKRCPACRSRLGSRTRPIVLGESNAVAPRPLMLVERELEARVEAKTAARYWQRRRAAKVARRIAALPPTVFQDVVETAGTSGAPGAVIDVPAASIHEARSSASVSEVVEPEVIDAEPEAVVDVAPEPEPEPEPVAEVVEPEPVVAQEAEPLTPPAPAPIMTSGPPRQNTAWTERVFSAEPWRRQSRAVTWPRPPQSPAPPRDDRQ